jgi:hypothetical protein
VGLVVSPGIADLRAVAFCVGSFGNVAGVDTGEIGGVTRIGLKPASVGVVSIGCGASGTSTGGISDTFNPVGINRGGVGAGIVIVGALAATCATVGGLTTAGAGTALELISNPLLL